MTAQDLSPLDAQLKFSAILPDFEDCLHRMDRASAAVSDGWQRVVYGEDPRQWIETRDGTGPADTVVLFFHGGYWRALDAISHRFVQPGLAGLGAHYANAEYRLMPIRRMADLAADAAGAARAALAGTGATKIVLAGHSAGAHLALSALHRFAKHAQLRSPTETRHHRKARKRPDSNSLPEQRPSHLA